MQKRNYSFIYYICSISFILLSLLSVIHFWCFNESFYQSEHRKLTLNNKPIAEYIGISNDELDELTSFTLNYLNDSNASLNKQMFINGELREVFTDDEKAHMVDVQKLNITSIYLSFIALIVFISTFLFICFNKLINQFYKVNNNVFKLFVVFISILIIWIVIDFNSFWNFFHHVFFAGNDLWILDLSKDILIMIVPPEFFFHLVSTIVISFIVVLIIYYLFIYYLNKRYIND